MRIYPDEVGDLLGGEEWQAAVGGPAPTQPQMDQAWATWLGQAAREIQEATGAEVEGVGEAYTFKEFDPLAQGSGHSRGFTGGNLLLVLQTACGGHRHWPEGAQGWLVHEALVSCRLRVWAGRGSTRPPHRSLC
jgi:hypothetical protein